MQRDDTTSSTADRHWIRRFVVVTVTLAVAIPTAAWAGHQFTDVPNSNIFHEDIDWMRDNGVTKGCNPPANTEYCPDDFVTRAQMAAFMHRLESEGVFQSESKFLVINYNLGTANEVESRGVTNWVREGPGLYLVTFDSNISNCVWTGAPGTRNNATFGTNTFYTIGLHSSSGGPNQIRVQLNDENGTDQDVSFNLAVHC